MPLSEKKSAERGEADFASLGLEELIRPEGFDCCCGRHHTALIKYLRVGRGAVDALPQAMEKCGGSRAFVIADENTMRAVGERVCSTLEKSGFGHTLFVFPDKRTEPDELSLGRALMCFDKSCDIVVGVGSGTINDICKMLASACGRPYIFVATAPSMDGYASNSAAMVSNGVKISVYCKAPDAVLADTEVLAAAPSEMLAAGLGDMLAKYVSICEWRIANLVNGEYYCENIASLMRASLKKCADAAEGVAARSPSAVGSVAEGLVLSGIAMSFAEVSRPASGIEHYFSHIWDMLALEKGELPQLHGIQVGVGTVLTLALYEQIVTLLPDREKALRFVESFSLEEWEADIRDFFGRAGEALIKAEHGDPKYNKEEHRVRLESLIEHWNDILRVIAEELPEKSEIIELLRKVGAPVSPEEIGISDALVNETLRHTKDIRKKYIASHLLWDIGEELILR